MRGISVVIPVYNEEENVAAGFREVSDVLRGIGLPYEVIYVDDGSRDRTVAALLESAGNDHTSASYNCAEISVRPRRCRPDSITLSTTL